MANIIGKLISKVRPDRAKNDAPKSPYSTAYNVRSGYSGILSSYNRDFSASRALNDPIVSRCIQMIASAVQSVNFYAESADEKYPASQDKIRKMNRLLSSPNDEYTGSMMSYWLAMNLACYGRAAFSVSTDSYNDPNGIYPLDASMVRVSTDDRGRAVSFIYGNLGCEQSFPSRNGVKNSANSWAYMISNPTLSGDLHGVKNDSIYPCKALSRPVNLIEALMVRAESQASGTLTAKHIAFIDSELDSNAKDEIEDFLRENSTFGSDSGNVLLVHGTTGDVKELKNDLSDIHSKVPVDDMSRIVYGKFGIPIALASLGSADGAKYSSNYAESKSYFYYDTILPQYAIPIANGLTKGVAPDGIVIKADIDSIPAILSSRISAMSDTKDIDWLTNDEKRELFGFKRA